ncbi:DUF1697 domain-containing protein [Sphingosinicella rhizophila]|uniref:DUF1697 domain-containing protein n=1 Tax=Sphingosinicella rhizophila TaxID=3050082 RepID=A0ABU3Q744_9SPHN|nr:DUF1697 domain-containing protein [Sphingosinicella sp. GR2756]MDT9599225.1 DUF1697 domain-containing protein [Sphingosinicella sp. GR2756]
MARFVALLRGINVGGHRRLPMADLRRVAEGIGLADVRTYVASGNLVFASVKDARTLETLLEEAIAGHFGFAVDVIVRSAAQWQAYVASNPLPDESRAHPHLVMIAVGKGKPGKAEVDALRARASPREKVRVAGDAIWFFFGDGAGRSKLGSAGKGGWTSRNWRTALKLREMLEE